MHNPDTIIHTYFNVSYVVYVALVHIIVISMYSSNNYATSERGGMDGCVLVSCTYYEKRERWGKVAHRSTGQQQDHKAGREGEKE